MNIIQSIIKRLTPEKYRIIHDPEFGYMACVWDNYGTLKALTCRGVADLHADSNLMASPLYNRDYFVKTEAEAGERINRHAAGRGRSIVWTGA